VPVIAVDQRRTALQKIKPLPQRPSRKHLEESVRHLEWLETLGVTAAGSQYSRALGAKLIKVDDFPINGVVGRLASIISHDNDQWVHYIGQQYLAGQQILQGMDLLPASATSLLTFQTLAGEVFTFQVPAGGNFAATSPDAGTGPIPYYLQNTGMYYWYAYPPQNHLLYFKIQPVHRNAGQPVRSLTASGGRSTPIRWIPSCSTTGAIPGAIRASSTRC
jgi:hypothetical protein